MDKILIGRRILVVEDEMMVLMMIEDMLTDLGCTSVTPAATVGQALTLIGEQVFDAAMVDLNLNGNTSYPVAAALAARDVPFVFSTGYTGQEVAEGYTDHPLLKKPFRFEELAQVMSRLNPSRIA